MIKYQQAVDANGRPIDGCAVPSDSVESRDLAISVAEEFTVPAGADVVFFTSDVPFWARYDGDAAVVPSGDSTAPLDYCPLARMVTPGNTISVVTDQTKADTNNGRIYLSYYKSAA